MSSSKKITLNRDWTFIQVRAQFAEKPPDYIWPEITLEQKNAYENSKLPGWETQIFVFPKCVLCAEPFDVIFTFKRGDRKYRVYPPFPLNEKSSASELFKDVKLPAGRIRQDHSAEISPGVVKGVVCTPNVREGIRYCHGLRIDADSDDPAIELYKEIVDQITIRAHQWWLRLGYDPFNGPCKITVDLDHQFDPISELRYRGAGTVASTWRGMNGSQKLLGFELPLTPTLWGRCLNSISNGIKAETGIIAFMDAVAYYMAGEDERCILNLALCFEILANKRYYADNGRFLSKNDKLLKSSRLVDSKNRKALHDLIIDRDHVAHGRPPYILGNAKHRVIEGYIEAGQSIVNNYLNTLGYGEWEQLSRTDLVSTRSRVKQKPAST